MTRVAEQIQREILEKITFSDTLHRRVKWFQYVKPALPSHPPQD